MTNTKQICDAIKGLPEGSLLSASFDERYQVVGTTDALKALVAENDSLKEQVAWIPFGGKGNVTLEYGQYIVTVHDEDEVDPIVLIAGWTQGLGFHTPDHYRHHVGNIIAYQPLPKPFQALAAADTARGDDDAD